MSDNNRAIALIEAVKHLAEQPANAAEVVQTAEAFLDFLNGGGYQAESEPEPSAPTSTSAKNGPSSAPAKKAAAPKAAKPARGSDTTAYEGPTQETIGTLVEQLLSANKRKEAVALMAKIGGKDAKSVTSLMASGGDLNKFVEEAEALLMAA
jgi:hypothetical protein